CPASVRSAATPAAMPALAFIKPRREIPDPVVLEPLIASLPRVDCYRGSLAERLRVFHPYSALRPWPIAIAPPSRRASRHRAFCLGRRGALRRGGSGARICGRRGAAPVRD